MQIQINTGSDVDADATLVNELEEEVRSSLDRFEEQITRVEVHLRDVNSDKGGRDHRCVIEARVKGMQPVAVDDQAETALAALRGAAGKLERALDSRLGRRDRR